MLVPGRNPAATMIFCIPFVGTIAPIVPMVVGCSVPLNAIATSSKKKLMRTAGLTGDFYEATIVGFIIIGSNFGQ